MDRSAFARFRSDPEDNLKSGAERAPDLGGMVRTLIFALFHTYAAVLFGQPADSVHYRLHKWIDGPIILGTAGAATLGAMVMNRQSALSVNTIRSLDEGAVNAFDRRAFSIDLDERREAKDHSDLVLRGAVLAPFLLSMDKRAREQWQPLLALYVEAMLVNSSVQTWTALSAGRIRPVAYLSGVPLEQRVEAVNHNSFFSGHTSATATSTFFIARVLDDLHPEFGRKRWLLYAGAAIPPALAGLYRIRAGKHFPTDVITGFVFGAGVGVLVPALHRTGRRGTFSMIPMPSSQGMSVSLFWSPSH